MARCPGLDGFRNTISFDPVAHHPTSQQLVFSTGAEVEFADHDPIIAQGRNDGHPVRAMMHAVVQSDLFRPRWRRMLPSHRVRATRPRVKCF
ncbi:MAG: DUF1585 domain-containing protein [Acidobacteriota bacterium]|nr:DUF1585 domain-containing protein [Acidobacteriota bacterium]